MSVMAISTFTGCGKKAEPQKAAETKGTPEEINVMVWDRGEQFQSGMTVTNNNLTKYIQESVLKEKNVKVNFTAVPRSGSDDKVVAMMAGGNAPDVILTYSRDVFGNFATQGGLADLTAILAAEGKTITKSIPKEVTDVGIIDGKQYAVMARRGIQVSRHVGYIRKDWLDALGLPVPKTNDELIKTLYAFKEKDPGKLGAKNIPWAMGGNTGSEKYYLSFVNSYIKKPYEGENLWTYQENQAALHPEAKAGFAQLNKLYNDGIISKDFAVDTKDDKYKADISNGNVGFILEDVGRPFDWFKAAQKVVPTAQYVVVNAFTGVNNEYKNPAEPAYGAYAMIPKKSGEAKAKAAVKYLDWLADVNNAMNVSFVPGYKTDANGIPVVPTTEEKLAKGYPNTTDDFNLVNKHFPYTDDDVKIAAFYNDAIKYADAEYMKGYAKSVRNAMVVYPVQQQILPNSSKYGKAVQDGAVQFAYKSISAPANQFDATYQSEYQKVVQAGFDKILKEKQDYYNQKVKK